MVSSLAPTTFLHAVAREVKRHYAEKGFEPQTRIRSRLAQFWWGNSPELHYEIALHERYLQIELGLHFEADARRNSALYTAFSSRFLEIQDVLGDAIWPEEWDRGWTRLYETHPFSPMDDQRVYAIAARFCEMIDCLQPILAEITGATGD